MRTRPSRRARHARAASASIGGSFCVCSIESGPCERVDVFHVSDDWIGYNVSDWFMRDMTTKELIIMADPNRPRHYEEEFKRQIVQS